MAGLPEGWEWDYDGKRWFYKYKPTGHIQYHFPKEGDEFPDFVDAAAPVPVLAPEERLESQQQIKRQTSTSRSGGGSSGSGSNAAPGWKSRMSASARPVSSVWEDDNDGVFQPENFMYLGPGTYTDVSPLAEEEEEAARRVVAGGIEDRVDGATPGKGVSPVGSERTTPLVIKGVPVQTEFAMGDMMMMAGDSMSGHIAVPPTVPEEPMVPMIDSREVQRVFDPIGVIAEMPTDDTAVSRAEVDPEPIEMADNLVLAPIETAVPEGFAELGSSPVEQKIHTQGTLVQGNAARDGMRAPRQQQHQLQQGVVPQQRIERRATDTVVEGGAGGYQPYKPGVATKPDVLSRGPAPMRDEDYGDKRKTNLQREQSLMMNTKPSGSGQINHSNIPAALAPPRQTFNKPAADAGPVVTGPDPPPKVPVPPGQGGLGYVPSVLKVARTGSPQGGPRSQSPGNIENGQGLQQANTGVSKFPSVLRPAGRQSQQPQQPQPQTLKPSQGQHLAHGYVPPKQGQHPASMTPSPLKQQQRQEQDPRLGVKRVNTVPDQVPSQTPDQRPQQSIQQHMNLPYNGRVPGGSSTVPPPQAAPFAAPQIEPIRRSDTQPLGDIATAPIGQPIPRPHTTAPYPPDEPKIVRQNTAPYPPDDPRPPVRQNTTPYPPDDPRPIRQNTAPYPPDEPKPLRRQSTAPYPDEPPPDQQPVYNRRHSSVVSDMVSPLDSRGSSASPGFPLQTPSPLESGRRASSSASLGQTFSPSPLSQGSGSSGQPQGSYFPPSQNVEGQGHAVSAQNKLRKKSLGRSDSSKRASLPPGQSPLSTPSTMNSGSLHRSQSLKQTSQGAVIPQQQPQPQPQPQQLQKQLPMPPLQEGSSPQGLMRIEEHEETSNMTVSRSSSRNTRRSSMASIQQSPQGSRRQSLQMAPGTEVRVDSPVQSAVPPGWNGQGRMPQQQIGQTPTQGQFPPQGHIVQGQMAPSGQEPIQPLAPLKMKASTQGQAPPGQGPPQGQLPPQGQVAPGSQILPQGQQPLQAHVRPQGQAPPQGQLPPGQALQNQPSAQGQMPSQGQRPIPNQGAPHLMQAQPHPGQMHHQRINSMPVGQMPPQGHFQAGQMPPGQVPPGHLVVQGQPPPGQVGPGGQMPPHGHMRAASQGQAPNGRVQPQVQIPQSQPQWNPNTQSPMGHGPRPGSVPPETPKENRLLKWFKGGNKSNNQSPTTSQNHSPASSTGNAAPQWGGGEYSEPAVWQPGMPIKGQRPPSNMPPPQQQQLGQMPPGSNGVSHTVAPLNIRPGSVPPGQAPPLQGPVGHVPPGRAPNQVPMGQLPTGQFPPGQVPPGQVPPVQRFPGQAPRSQVPQTGPILAPPNQGPPRGAPINMLPAKAPSPVPLKQAPPPTEVSPLLEKSKMAPPNAPMPVQNQQPGSRMHPPALLPESARCGHTPPPPEPSPVPSDMGPPPLSQIPPGNRDSFSDASFIEVSEAKPQPVLRPHVVQVHRRPADLHEGMSRTQTPTQPPLQPPAQPLAPPQPRTNERPVSREKIASTFSLPSQRQNVQSEPPQEGPERSLTPAPLFSKPNSPASSKSGAISPPALRSPQAKQFEPAPLAQQPPPAKAQPPVDDKWAKKPVVDYSGGDWGDDDDWDY
ncbi:hypothetical protein B0T10DRAFT_267246 [Thelonectria olida]|uniref:WW domain-containing protein n=1 Tax=Thelonectria olida TaxID=1576542 RepID=A0A9P8WBI3_9HYPO|nr:hypothetical protein B0T10DRAFT_267246 [Thelonectria olida]